jgi:hypothetical protein
VKNKLGEVWKDKITGLWMVQFTKGIDGFKTKKEAKKWSEITLKNKVFNS